LIPSFGIKGALVDRFNQIVVGKLPHECPILVLMIVAIASCLFHPSLSNMELPRASKPR
jgi:hypothetical protein